MSTGKELENKAIVKKFIEGFWNTRNLSVLDEVDSPEVQYHGPSMEFHNLEELKNLTRSFMLGFHDTKMTTKDQIAKDDTVVSRFDFEGIHKGEFAGLPPTGKKVKIAGISITRFVKNKIVDEWELFDEMGLMKQLGMELQPQEVVH